VNNSQTATSATKLNLSFLFSPDPALSKWQLSAIYMFPAYFLMFSSGFGFFVGFFLELVFFFGIEFIVSSFLRAINSPYLELEL